MHRKRNLFPQGICFSCRKACQLPWQMHRLLVFIHGTNGFTIADQFWTGAGDASDCVDDVSRVPQHSGKDRRLLPEQLATGRPPIVHISGGSLMWRRNGSCAFCVPVFLSLKSLLSLVRTRCSYHLGLSLLRPWRNGTQPPIVPWLAPAAQWHLLLIPSFTSSAPIPWLSWHSSCWLPPLQPLAALLGPFQLSCQSYRFGCPQKTAQLRLDSPDLSAVNSQVLCLPIEWPWGFLCLGFLLGTRVKCSQLWAGLWPLHLIC